MTKRILFLLLILTAVLVVDPASAACYRWDCTNQGAEGPAQCWMMFSGSGEYNNLPYSQYCESYRQCFAGNNCHYSCRYTVLCYEL